MTKYWLLTVVQQIGSLQTQYTTELVEAGSPSDWLQKEWRRSLNWPHIVYAEEISHERYLDMTKRRQEHRDAEVDRLLRKPA